MSTRVVRTVEELEGLPVGTPLLLASGRVAEISNHDIHGPALCATNGMVQPLARAHMFLPATVLVPLSVTSEQVEAGARASFSGDYFFSAETWDAYPFDHPVKRHERKRLTAALAAMGIPVVDSE